MDNLCITLWKACGKPVDKTPSIIIVFKRLKEIIVVKHLNGRKPNIFFFLLFFFWSVNVKNMTATANTFSMSTRDLKALARLFKKSPRKMAQVAAGVLNTEAFGLRTSILKILDKEMTIRSPGFVKSRVRVVKARTGPINSIESETGSIFSDRFSGWKEQQFGTESDRESVPTRFSRGGSWQGRMRASLRSRQKNPLWRMSDFNITNAKNKKHRLIIYLQILDKRKIKQRFFFPGSLGKMRPTVYKRQGEKFRGVSNPKQKLKKTARIPWMDKSIDLLLKDVSPQAIWERNVKHVFRLK